MVMGAIFSIGTVCVIIIVALFMLHYEEKKRIPTGAGL
jgi:hypothetical protein